jgi:hypothetical protein
VGSKGKKNKTPGQWLRGEGCEGPLWSTENPRSGRHFAFGLGHAGRRNKQSIGGPAGKGVKRWLPGGLVGIHCPVRGVCVCDCHWEAGSTRCGVGHQWCCRTYLTNELNLVISVVAVRGSFARLFLGDCGLKVRGGKTGDNQSS